MQLPAARLVRENRNTSLLSPPMAESTPSAAPRTTTAGHLSVYVEGAHPAEIPFLFERQPKRLGFAIGSSAVIQVLMFALLILASRYQTPRRAGLRAASREPQQRHHLAERTWPWRGRRWRRQQDERAAPQGRTARQRQNHRAGGEAAEARAGPDEKRPARHRAAEYSGEDARVGRGLAARRHRRAAGSTHDFAGERVGRWRRHGHRIGHRARHRLRARTRQWRRHWWRRLPAGQRRDASRRAPGKETPVPPPTRCARRSRGPCSSNAS